MFNADGEIILCNVPFSPENDHVIKFNGETEKENYFRDRAVKSFSNIQFVMKDMESGSILVKAHVDSIQSANYVMYYNRGTSRYYYGFITSKRYVNSATTEIVVLSDVFQNWINKVTFRKCYIERETPLEDYENTLADDLSQGHLVKIKEVKEELSGGYFVLCASSILENDVSKKQTTGLNVGNYSIPAMCLYYPISEAVQCSRDLKTIANTGRGDRILSAFYSPFLADSTGIKRTYKYLWKDNETEKVAEDVLCSVPVVDSIPSGAFAKTISFTIPDVGAKKKLNTYPFSVIRVVDNASGAMIELAPDKFASREISFKIISSLSSTPLVKVIPLNYEGVAENVQNALVISCNTNLPVTNNIYANYLARNGTFNDKAKMYNVIGSGLSAVGSLAGAIASGMSGNIAGAVSGVAGVGEAVNSGFQNANEIARQEYQAKLSGYSCNNISDDAMIRMNFLNSISIELFSVDYNHKKAIESYWSAYGYPVREVKALHMGTSPYFIKVAEPNISGNGVPANELKRLESLFIAGITIWSKDNYRAY
jgi:hypothetical protein